MKHCYRILMIIVLSMAVVSVKAQTAETQIIQAMNQAAEQWNKGDLDGYMALYDTAATMMMPTGRAKLGGVRALYEKYYFENGQPKQMLAYDSYQFTPLGPDYALLTGRFILKPNEKMKERTGTFSLVLVRRHNEWKILHDHSGS
ncbi:MAG: YybH family protein [Flavisolibacter sp.]